MAQTSFVRAKTAVTNAETIRFDVAQMLREIVGDVPVGTSLKAVWRDLATKLRLTVGQVTRLWYQLQTVVPAHIYLTVRNAWDRKSFLAAQLETTIDVRAIAFQERRQRVEARRV